MLKHRVDHLIGRGDPASPALTFKTTTLTYAELARRVAEVAGGLHALGVRRGDRVAVYAEKRIETVVAVLATAAAGAVFVPVNPLFKARHLGYVLADCGPRVVLTTKERLETVREALSPSVEHVVVFGTPEWDALSGEAPEAGVIDDDPAAIMYTSGSTGGPKGVVLSHRNILAGAASVATYLGHTNEDVVLAALPLSFDAGFSQLTTSLYAGAHVVLVNYLLPKEIVRLCAKHGVTGLTRPTWIQPKRKGARTRSARPSPTPRSSSSARTARRARPVSTASSCTAAPWWRWGTGTTRSARRSGSVPRRARSWPDGRRSRCGPATWPIATRKASSTSSAGPTR